MLWLEFVASIYRSNSRPLILREIAGFDMEDRKRLPSLKNVLIYANNDLDWIIENSYLWYNHLPLNDLEYYTLVLEDRRFFSHSGMDALSVAREIGKLVLTRKSGGASTVDMQYVRTLTKNYDRTVSRKIYEIFLSTILRYHIDKIALLRSYLDHAYFGNTLTGSEAAAQKVFQKSATDLKGMEAAFIAAMLVYPRPKNPSQEWARRVMQRASYGIRIGARLEKRFQKIGVR
jgi:membrane peptidoglycan carboxypeptidase